MISQYIITLLSAVISLYLPFGDVATKVACSMSLSQIVVIIGEKIFDSFFKNFNFNKLFFNENYIIIKHENPFYEKFIELLYRKYNNLLNGCSLHNEFGQYKMVIEELKKKDLIDEFISNGKKYTMKIKLGNIEKNDNKDTKIKINYKDIIICSKANLGIIEEYVFDLIKKCTQKMANNLKIYKVHGNSKKNAFNWKKYTFKTNKNFNNTIVSEDVNKYFIEDIKKFIDSEEFYMVKGLAFKRGYLLHGEPGCGKTSIIKTIANEYNLPIFIVDLNMFEENKDLVKIVSDINGHISNKQKHMLVFEDVDRAKFFDRYCDYRTRVSEDCILNILDGLDESYGRITILTTNNLKKIKAMQALVRPGRIDVTIHVTHCTVEQIKKMFELYFDNPLEQEINTSVIITPAKLIQLFTLIKDNTKIAPFLNKHNDFTDFDVEKYIDIVSNNDNSDEKGIDLKDVETKTDKSKNNLFKPYWQRRFEKKEKMFNKFKDRFKLIEDTIDLTGEKNKLVFEKKKLDFKIRQLEYETSKKKCEFMEQQDAIYKQNNPTPQENNSETDYSDTNDY
jgi:AAA+ superfamily predicted ATPase